MQCKLCEYVFVVVVGLAAVRIFFVFVVGLVAARTYIFCIDLTDLADLGCSAHMFNFVVDLGGSARIFYYC